MSATAPSTTATTSSGGSWRLILPCEDTPNWERTRRVFLEHLPCRCISATATYGTPGPADVGAEGALGGNGNGYGDVDAGVGVGCNCGCDWAAYLDSVITEMAVSITDQKCHFFKNIPGSPDAGQFDFPTFWKFGAPLMVSVALEMPRLFAGVDVPLLLAGDSKTVVLSHRQCACLLAHSAFGSITAQARCVRKEKWAFRAAQLFFLEAVPSALCFLNYFKCLGQHGIPDGSVTFERRGFKRGVPTPWQWDGCTKLLCPVEIVPSGSIENSPAETHADFANRFIGGGALENDFMMEEILFAIKPELIVSMALSSFMQDEEAIVITGARQYSCYSGYSHSFTFEGDYDDRRPGPPPAVAAMDALQGFAKIQFQEGLVLRDLNKARVAFGGSRTVATGNWGCGAFGNDHVLKLLQQWLAASEAGATRLYYHIFNDKRISSDAPPLLAGLSHLDVGQLYTALMDAAKAAATGGGALTFRKCLLSRANKEAAQILQQQQQLLLNNNNNSATTSSSSSTTDATAAATTITTTESSSS
ncbi:poly glycohydrolase [Pelomyxa schiedti]|nr:poly glycohydrolase [Pelomyxa schiedti]KAH3744056.1 poly glycohydrolase [Pelomyxa schiedti]